MATKRKATAPTTEAIDQFCAAFDELFARYEERTALRQYLIGLLVPREHNKTLVELGAIVPGANRQALQHFMRDAPWDAQALNRRRLQRWQAHPYLGPHAGGVLSVEETGDPKRGHRIVLAAQQHIGKPGHVANGVVAVTSQWADGGRHVPLGVKPYRPASRLPQGKKDPDCHTRPQLGWQLIAEARAAGIPFRLVVADAIYGENAELEAKRFGAQIPYILGLKPAHGTWQVVEDPTTPPRLHPRRSRRPSAARLPIEAGQRTVRCDRHGKELVRHIVELELGTAYGPTKSVRLVAATRDPRQLTPESTRYLATALPHAQVSAEQVDEIYRLRDWIEQYCTPVKHELGWADYQLRPERAIVRHWQLVLLAATFSLLVGAASLLVGAAPALPSSPTGTAAGGKIGVHQRRRVRGAGRLERGAPSSARVAVPLGAAAARVATLVERRPAARAGRAPRPRRSLPPA